MQKFKKSFSAHRLLYMLHLGLGIWGRSRCDVADVSYSRWVRKRMYFDISITHNTLHHRGQSRGQRGEETSFILTPAQLHSINIVKLRQGSGKDWQGSARQKALKLKPLPRAYIKVGCHLPPTRKSQFVFN